MIRLLLIAVGILAPRTALASAAQYFSPRPGTTVTLSELDVAGLVKSGDPKRLRGFIEVNPPKGCIEVFRGEETGAEMVCEKKNLSFRLGDIDRAGRLTWSVKTSNLDPGTTLQWQTPFRLAMITPRERSNTQPPEKKADYWRDLPIEYKYIKSCRDVSNQHFRAIEVSFFSGRPWRFHFPDKHQLLPQPNAVPNLTIASVGQKRGLSGDEKPTGPKEEEIVAEPPKKDGAADEGPSAKENPADSAKPTEAAKAPADGKAAEAAPKEEAPDNNADRAIWSVPLRGSYVMSTDNFLPDATKQRGTRGVCRYNFQGPEDDPQTGRIECQNAPYFHMILLPLTCLKSVQGDR